jgi:hypothetical protein
MRYRNRDNWETQTHRTRFIRGDYYVIFQESSDITSYCDRTFPSWSHDVTLRHWACFQAQKQSPVPPKVHRDPFHNVTKVFVYFYVRHKTVETHRSSIFLVTAHFRFKSSYCNKMAGPGAKMPVWAQSSDCYFKALQVKKDVRSKIIGAFRLSCTIEPDYVILETK